MPCSRRSRPSYGPTCAAPGCCARTRRCQRERSVGRKRSAVSDMLLCQLLPAYCGQEEAMRLGVVGMLPDDFRTYTPAQIEAITALGFTGFGCHLDGALAF